MDFYVVNANFLKTDVVETFQSIIWTERYNQFGDVTLVWSVGGPLDDLIKEGVFLHTPDSKEIMLIDTVSTDKGVSTATGQSLVGFLVNRIFRDTWSTAKDSWSLTGVPGALAQYVVQQMCMSGGIMAGTGIIPGGGASEVIPHLSLGAAASGSSVTIAVPYGTVYDAVKTICDLDNLGFSLYPPSVLDGSGSLVFTTYRGLDRTTDQSTNEVVIFEPAMETLTDITELRSIAGYKTAAYAWANGMTAQSSLGIAFAPGTDTLVGFDRRTLMVDASDVNATDYSATDLKAVLDKRAKNGLANNNYVRMTDGTIVPQPNFIYGINYNLGDVIELRGPSNVAEQARVLEYIRSQSSTGYAAYPTLSVIS